MSDHETFGCDDHSEMRPHKKHPDGGKQNSQMLKDHERAVGHPKQHTVGKMLAQLNPDHGPHK